MHPLYEWMPLFSLLRMFFLMNFIVRVELSPLYGNLKKQLEKSGSHYHRQRAVEPGFGFFDSCKQA
jgi:hypothetical protein